MTGEEIIFDGDALVPIWAQDHPLSCEYLKALLGKGCLLGSRSSWDHLKIQRLLSATARPALEATFVFSCGWI